MPFASQEFDRITIGFGFRNLVWQNPNQSRHLEEMSRVLKPGARLLILESAVPENAFVSFFYRIYLKLILVPLGGILSGNWKAYRYLAGSSSGFYDFSTLKSMMEPYKLYPPIRKKIFVWFGKPAYSHKERNLIPASILYKSDLLSLRS